MSVREICRLAPVIPVLTVEDARNARGLAEALVTGGLPVLEVTLRTVAALDVIAEMTQVDGAVVGAGTLLNRHDVARAVDAGALFGVSPGLTGELADAARAARLQLLPGVATPSEAMAAAEVGFDVLKFFPAGPNGGPAALRAWAAPLPRLSFCPTGGVSAANAPEYLALPNVICVGGSWVAPPEMVAAKDWAGIEALARQAAALA